MHLPHYLPKTFHLTYTCLAIGMFFLGAAFSSVFIGLVTYLIIETPRHLSISVTILFAFMNLGAMLSAFFLDLFNTWLSGRLFLITMEVLILLSIVYILVFFFEPKFPKHLKNLKKSTSLWREMHYRLILFIIVIILYGICENTYNLWGDKFLHFFLTPHVANDTISIFWLFMIIGQILTLIPLYFTSARNVFYFLIFLMIISLFTFPFQTKLPGFIAMLALGGCACSACFPILLSLMEDEFKAIEKTSTSHIRILPYLESGLAWLIIGYIIGTGIVTMKIQFDQNPTMSTVSSNFFLAILYAVIILIITYYLSITFQKKKRKQKEMEKEMEKEV